MHWNYAFTLTSPLAWPVAYPLLTQIFRRWMLGCLREIAAIAECYRAYRAGDRPRVAGFCAVASMIDLQARHFNLSPARYVGTAPDARAPETTRDTLRRLALEWEELALEAERTAQEIRDLGLS